MEVVSGGPDEPGSLARLHYEQAGRAYVMDDELLECDPGWRWRSRVSGNGMTIVVVTELEETQRGSVLRMTWDG